MAHILMLESWIGGNGRILPVAIREQGHSYTFVTRRLEHYDSTLSDEMHPVLAHADSVIVAETNDLDDLCSALEGKTFDGVLTVCDYYVDMAALLAARLSLPCPFPAAVGTVRHKGFVRKKLEEAGLPGPRFVRADNWESLLQGALDLGFPLILKPADLASSAFVTKVENEADLRRSFEALDGFKKNFRDQPREREFLLEEFLQGPEFSVETIHFRGEASVIGVTDKLVVGDPFFIEAGHMFPADVTSAQRQQLVDYALKALEALHFNHGVAHTEVKLTPQGPRLIEINPRLPGNYIVELVQHVTSLDMLKAFVDLSLGHRPDLENKKDEGSAAVAFWVPHSSGTVTSVEGADAAETSCGVVRHHFEDLLGKQIGPAIDNACYLGHVVTRDSSGLRAGAWAEKALANLSLVLVDDSKKR